MVKNEYVVSNEAKNIEQQIFDKIYDCCERNISFRFESGAGSGKTYCLTNVVKRLIKNKTKLLNSNSQMIKVITFTNAATDELKSRIGQTEIVDSSTIHSFLWNAISQYQSLLLAKFEKYVCQKRQDEIKAGERYQECVDLIEDDIFERIINDNNFYQATNSQQMIELFSRYGLSMSITNAQSFKKSFLVRKNKNKYDELFGKLKNGKEKVVYDINSNVENVFRFRINHDTLLIFASEILNEHKFIRKIIEDKYPFLFVDEYQDCSKYVINILRNINSDQNNVIGLFGDEYQNIYGNGLISCGEIEKQFVESLKLINKPYSRRCSEQVLNVANNVRKDFEQKTVYTNHNDGIVTFETMLGNVTKFDVQNIIIKNGISGKTICLFFKNKMLANFLGFDVLYDAVSKLPKYFGNKRDDLTSDFLSNDLSRMLPEFLFIFRLISLWKMAVCKKTTITDVFKNGISESRIIDYKNFIYEISKINFADLRLQDYFCKIKTISKTFGLEKQLCGSLYSNSFLSFDEIMTRINERLYDSTNDVKNGDSIFAINMDIWEKWYAYLKNEGEIIASTYHNSKGLEYDNVVLFLNDSFNTKKDSFTNYLTKLVGHEHDNDEIKPARNLFYVGITRAIKNLVFVNSIESIDTKKLEQVLLRE